MNIADVVLEPFIFLMSLDTWVVDAWYLSQIVVLSPIYVLKLHLLTFCLDQQ